MDALILFLDYGFAIALFVNAMLFLPQIIRLWQKKDSQDISLLTFLGFNVINLMSLIHGIIKHDPYMIVGYSISFVMNTVTSFLIVKYRKC